MVNKIKKNWLHVVGIFSTLIMTAMIVACNSASKEEPTTTKKMEQTESTTTAVENNESKEEFTTEPISKEETTVDNTEETTTESKSDKATEVESTRHEEVTTTVKPTTPTKEETTTEVATTTKKEETTTKKKEENTTTAVKEEETTVFDYYALPEYSKYSHLKGEFVKYDFFPYELLKIYNSSADGLVGFVSNYNPNYPFVMGPGEVGYFTASFHAYENTDAIYYESRKVAEEIFGLTGAEFDYFTLHQGGLWGRYREGIIAWECWKIRPECYDEYNEMFPDNTLGLK